MTKERLIINKIMPDLPILAYPEREVLPKMRDHFMDTIITLKTELEIHEMLDMGDAGGIVCEIKIPGAASSMEESTFLVSITHLKIKRGEPHYLELEEYRQKRIRKLMRQDRKNRFF